MSKIITTYISKGGVGKSTFTLLFGQIKAKYENKKVLILDLDHQASSTKQLLSKDTTINYTITDVIYGNCNIKESILTYSGNDFEIDFIPAEKGLEDTNNKLLLESSKIPAHNRLQFALKDIVDDYDYIFIDCPTAPDFRTINAFVVSDGIIVPFGSDKFNEEGLEDMLDTMEDIRKYYNPKLCLTGVFQNCYTNTLTCKESDKFMDKLRKLNVCTVCDTKMPLATEIKENTYESFLLCEKKFRNKDVVEIAKKILAELEI
jgi:chromosome partitioning protein